MNGMAIAIFVFFVTFVMAMSFYLARRAKSAHGFFAAGGTIHWSVNGISFAGDYLSAASFLGICGMIATVGYDGFLYSIGYLAGWIVALFVVAEPMKRLGKYTFTDALDAKFNHKGIQLAAAVSTLIVSICYLIPQMVGAGALINPLLGLAHHWGVIMVGGIVIFIVATAGMASTTYVQFLKGALLIVFSTILVFVVLNRGVSTRPDQDGEVPFYEYQSIAAAEIDGELVLADQSWEVAGVTQMKNVTLVKLLKEGRESYWKMEADGEGSAVLQETQSRITTPDGTSTYVRASGSMEDFAQVGNLVSVAGSDKSTGALGPLSFLSTIADKETVVKLWKKASFTDGEARVTTYYPVLESGNRIMRPGGKFKVEGTFTDKLNFISLMLALFCGTAALPHILIRYYTVPSPACARKSTIVAITAIGFFYILTLYLGLGAMVNNVINPADNNMSAPLLARSFGTFLFSMICAIAFATVLGTVSGLIVAASGAVAHDLMHNFCRMDLTERGKVFAGKAAAVGVGLLAIVLGIIFKGMNVSYLVGWAFAVAASANLPAILMLLFWKKTTAKGIVASIIVGIVAALGIILLSPAMYVRYGLEAASAPFPISNPGIISIPLSFVALVVVSLMTQKMPGKTHPPVHHDHPGPHPTG